MKKILRDSKSTLSIALVIMLVLSMMMGVFSLSASADEDTLNPKVTNNPVITLQDYESYYNNYVPESYYDNPLEDNIWRKCLSTICVSIDDSESQRKLSSVNHVTYTYNCGDVEFSDDAFYKTVNDFNLMLVNTPLNYHASNIIEGKWSDKFTSYYYYKNYRTTKAKFRQFLDNLHQSELTLNIYYDDDPVPQNVKVDICMSDHLPIQRENWIYGGYSTTQTEIITVKISNGNKSEDEAFTKLANAISEVQSINNDSISRLYVDIDSKDPIVLPMNDISRTAQLVQTRIGDNVIYNRLGSVDFGDSSVSSLQSDDETDESGNIYLLPNGSYSSDDDLFELWKYMCSKDYGYYYLFVDGKLYDLDLEKLGQMNYSIPNFKDGYFVKNVSDYYTGIPGAPNENEVINNVYSEKTFKNKYTDSYSTSRDGSLNLFSLAFKNMTWEKSTNLYNKLVELRETSYFSETEKKYLKMTSNYGEWKSQLTFNTHYTYNYNNESDSRKEIFRYICNYFGDNAYSYYNREKTYITGMFFYVWDHTYGINGIIKNIPDESAYSFFNKLYSVVTDLGIELDYENSYYPHSEKFNSKEEDRIYVSDILEEIGVKVEKGKNKAYLAYEDYFGTYSTTSYSFNTVKRDQKLHETYELGELGKYVLETTLDNHDIDTEAYDNETRNISFMYNKVKDNVNKGTVYNVVNQIQISNIDVYGTFNINENSSFSRNNVTYFETFDRWNSNDLNAVYHLLFGYRNTDYAAGEESMSYSNRVYYLGGDNIVSSNSAYISYNNYQFGTVRNTEYKWGEIVFVSKPDSVQDLAFDNDTQILTWTKPVDEGFGTIDGKTNKDDYIKITEYNVKLKDNKGNVVYTKTLPRTNKDTLSIPLGNLHLENAKYTAEVTAKNVINESQPKSVTFDLRMPDVEITMTPDQPRYEINDTITFTESVINTGKVTLTNVTVTQSVYGEYNEKKGVKTNGKIAVIETLDVGQRVNLEYKTPASIEVMNIIKNTAEVTTNQNVTDKATTTITIIKPGLSVVTSTDKNIYKDGETVVLTSVVTNTGNETINNIELKHDIDIGEFKNLDTEKIITGEKKNTVVIKELSQGDSISVVYEIPAKDIETGKNAAAEIVTMAKTANERLTAASVVNFTVKRPALLVNAKADEDVVVFGNDVVYTVVVSNNGNCTLNNVTISSDLKGTFAENEAGSVNKIGDFIIPELAEGKKVTLVYTVNAKNTTYGKNTNNFIAKDDSDNKDSYSVDVELLNYKVNIIKLVDNADHYLGEQILFRGIVTNRGNYELKNITVTEDLNGKFEISDGAKLIGNNSIVIDSIMPGESYTYDYYVTATEDIIIDGKLTGTATTDAGDNIKSSNKNYVTVYSPSLTVDKTVDDKKIYKVGDTVEWTDVITNTGNCDLTNIIVTENFNGTFNTTYKPEGNAVTIPVLKEGESVEIRYTTTVYAGDLSNSTYTCKVDVTTDQNVDETASASVKVTGPAFTVKKYSDKQTYYPEDEIVFSDAIINVGDKKLTNVIVTEDLEGDFIRIGDDFTAEGNKIVIPEIDVGDSAVVCFSVDRNSLTNDEVTSTVTVTCDQKITDTSTLTIILAEDTSDSDTTTDTSSEDTTTDKTSSDTVTDTSSEDTTTDKTSSDTVTDTSSGDTTTDKTSSDTVTDTTTDDIVTDTTKGDTTTDNTTTDSTATDDTTTDKTSDDTVTDTSKEDTTTDGTNTDDSTTDTTSDNTETDTRKESEDQPVKYRKGDVNMDGKITARDSLVIQRSTIGLENLSEVQIFIADVNGDERVSSADSLHVLRYTVKLPTTSDTGEYVDIPEDLQKHIHINS